MLVTAIKGAVLAKSLVICRFANPDSIRVWRTAPSSHPVYYR